MHIMNMNYFTFFLSLGNLSILSFTDDGRMTLRIIRNKILQVNSTGVFNCAFKCVLIKQVHFLS